MAQDGRLRIGYQGWMFSRVSDRAAAGFLCSVVVRCQGVAKLVEQDVQGARPTPQVLDACRGPAR